MESKYVYIKKVIHIKQIASKSKAALPGISLVVV